MGGTQYNSYRHGCLFASIEQRDNPELRGKPIVVGFDGPRGVVSTASYEARKYGIHSAMSIFKAKSCVHN